MEDQRSFMKYLIWLVLWLCTLYVYYYYRYSTQISYTDGYYTLIRLLSANLYATYYLWQLLTE